MFLDDLLDQLAEYIPKRNVINKDVSVVGVDWHIDHALKSVILICKSLKLSNPDKFSWEFSLSRSFVLTSESIPRGKGVAPPISLPPEEITVKDINRQLAEARKIAAEAEKLPSNSHFRHGYFGTLRLDDSLQYIRIHTDHHLKIIQDILGLEEATAKK